MSEQNLFTFRPVLKETLWGGKQIAVYKGLNTSENLTVGESWELSAMPDNESVVEDGLFAGKTLSQLVECLREALVGREAYAKYGCRFPLLVKFIDAHDDLSVQVHPDDRLAAEWKLPSGKNEMWYVVRCEPGSELVNGFNRQLGSEEFNRRVKEGTLLEVLRRYPVARGEACYLPAGRVHSIGAGCMICEIQQSCDVTYRIYDYDRKDAQGRLRPLHVQEALSAIDFTMKDDVGVLPALKEGTVVYRPLVESPHFCVSEYDLFKTVRCDLTTYDGFVVLICVEGMCKVMTHAGEARMLSQGHTVLVAARCEGIVMEPQAKGTRLLYCTL